MDCSTFKEGQTVVIRKVDGSTIRGEVKVVSNSVSISVGGTYPVKIQGSYIKSFEVVLDFQVGDIWEANGEEYYVREWRGGGGGVIIEGFSGGMRRSYRDTELNTLKNFAELDPTLIRRRK